MQAEPSSKAVRYHNTPTKQQAMKTFSTLSSLLVIGALGFLATAWFTSEELNLDMSEEDIHLYL